MRRLPLLAALVLVSFFVLDCRAQSNDVFVQEGSLLWIEGASTVNEWTCTAADLEGRAAVRLEPAIRNPHAAAKPVARLAVATESFECGKARMNRDFLHALQADRHPEIIFELIDAEVLDGPSDQNGWYRLHVRGNLTIAGATRTVEAEAIGTRLSNGQFRLQGSKQLTMTAFGVQPPVALLGLVRAKDQIEVHFDLRAGVDDMASL